jgi:hypothetical protein
MNILIYGTLFWFAAVCVGLILYGMQQARTGDGVGQDPPRTTDVTQAPDTELEAEPEAAAEPAPEPQPSLQVDFPADGLAQEGLYIGETWSTDPPLFWRYPLEKVCVHDFPSEDRFKHTYIIGLTGAGKTTVLRHFIPQDIQDRDIDNKGVIVMGPDRGLFDDLAACVPRWRANDVVYFNPTRVYGDKVVGWNPLDFSEGRDLPEELWQPLYQQKVGSVFKVLSRTLESVTEPQTELLLEAIYGLVALEQTALKDFDALFDANNSTLRQAVANTRRVEERTRRFWRNYDNDSAHQASATALRKKFVSLFHEPLATLFSSHAFTWRDLLAQPRIIFIDLSQIGSPAKETVAELVLAEIEVEIIRREQSRREKIPYYLYIDEFADFIRAGESTNELFAKARKNWLGFTLAHQVMNQVPANVRAVVEGNAQTCIALKLSHQDAPSFAKKMQLHLFDEAGYHAAIKRHEDAFSNDREEDIRYLENSTSRWGTLKNLHARAFSSPTAEEKQQWRKEALRAAYDSDVSTELLMNLQPGQAVVQLPGSFPWGIPVTIPLPPERSGNAHLLDASIQRWGVARTPASAPSAPEEEPSVMEDFDEPSPEQFLQQKPPRRTRRGDGSGC